VCLAQQITKVWEQGETSAVSQRAVRGEVSGGQELSELAHLHGAADHRHRQRLAIDYQRRVPSNLAVSVPPLRGSVSTIPVNVTSCPSKSIVTLDSSH